LLPGIGGRNGQGQQPYSYGTLLKRWTKWLAGLELVDATGRPVTVSPHQFRHTLGTRMINEDIPLEVIRRMHEQESTTRGYLHGDLRLKQRAIDRTAAPHTRPGRYRPTDSLLAFLNNL
jgi:integrase